MQYLILTMLPKLFKIIIIMKYKYVVCSHFVYATAEAPLGVSVAGAPSTGIGANEVSPVPAPSRSSSGASSLLAPIVLLVAAASFSLF